MSGRLSACRTEPVGTGLRCDCPDGSGFHISVRPARVACPLLLIQGAHHPLEVAGSFFRRLLFYPGRVPEKCSARPRARQMAFKRGAGYLYSPQ